MSREQKKDAVDVVVTPKARPSSPPPANTSSIDWSTVTVSQETLEETVPRMMLFLRAVGTTGAIRALLATRGYDAAEHARGWHLVHAVSGYEATTKVDTVDVSKALAEIDAWDEPNFAIAEAALRHRHPAQHAFVFNDLRPARGAAAVVGVTRFLDRLDALERDPRRAATREDDHAALKTLAARGITADERSRVRALVVASEQFGATPHVPAEVLAVKHDTALRELRAFYEEWSAVARNVVSRRDHLIRLGLAQRRAPSVDDTPDTPVDDTPKPA